MVYSYNRILYVVMDKKKESRHKREHTLLFTVYKVSKQERKLIYDIRSQDGV